LSGRPVALVVGNETDGVGDEVLALADHVVRIPMSGEVESLNVGVATGISLYELRGLMVLATLGPTVDELVATVSDLRASGYVGEDVTGLSEAERTQLSGFLRRVRQSLRRDDFPGNE
jgi:TrmH family RNA methyltransferase